MFIDLKLKLMGFKTI